MIVPYDDEVPLAVYPSRRGRNLGHRGGQASRPHRKVLVVPLCCVAFWLTVYNAISVVYLTNILSINHPKTSNYKITHDKCQLAATVLVPRRNVR